MNFNKDTNYVWKMYKHKESLFAVKFKVYIDTVNVEICGQSIFLCILRRPIGAQKFDVTENYYHKRSNRINWYVCKNYNTNMLHTHRA